MNGKEVGTVTYGKQLSADKDGNIEIPITDEEIRIRAQELFEEDGHAGDLYESNFTMMYETRALKELEDGENHHQD